MKIFQPQQISPTQAETLEIIRSFVKAKGYPPSCRDIQAARGKNYIGSWLYKSLQVLAEKGYIVLSSSKKSRAIRLVLS